MTIGDISQGPVVTAAPDTTVAGVAELMAEQNVGCVPLVEDDEPVGVVTDRAIALALAEESAIADHRVGSIMTTELVTVHESDGIAEVTRLLSDHGVRRVPVVDDDGDLVGIVSIDDIAVLLVEELDDLEDVIEAQSPRL